MLGGRAGEILSRWETPSQCGRVGSPDVIFRLSQTRCFKFLVARTSISAEIQL